jgi:hypothetical protein
MCNKELEADLEECDVLADHVLEVAVARELVDLVFLEDERAGPST